MYFTQNLDFMGDLTAYTYKSTDTIIYVKK